ncbi:MAG TPA: alpha-amylase family glycosyl hydrolase [Myxococcota bacterium]
MTLLVLDASPGAVVEVAGDFPVHGGLPDFRRPLRLKEEQPGHFRIALDLAPGVYRYKFLVDGAWTLDAHGARVDECEGVTNNVLVVDGTAEPVRFAPDRRHAVRVDDRVLARLESDAVSPPPRVALASMPLAVREVLRRGGRALYDVDANVHGSKDAALLVDGARFPLVTRATSEAPPAWLEGAVIYGVLIDRWRRGSGSPSERRMLARTTPSTPHCFYGGDLDGVREHLSYIRDLGATAVALTPVQHSDSPHRYDGIDPLAVDERLGGARALDALVDAGDKLGLKLIVDASLTHVHEKHAAFQDLLARQSASPFASWFRVQQFPVRARDPSTVGLYYNVKSLVWLDLDGPAREHAMQAALSLLNRGVHGLRLDAMNNAPARFWRELRARVRTHHPHALLLGELVTDDLASVAEERGCDVVTDFRMRDALVAFARSHDARAFVDAWTFARHRTGAFHASFRLGFLDNHDTARFLSLVKDERKLRVALAILLFAEETAWITYGTEAHLAAYTGERVLDASWPERIAMPEPGLVDTATLTLIREACARRRALRGALSVLESDGARLVLARGDCTLTVDMRDGEPIYA